MDKQQPSKVAQIDKKNSTKTGNNSNNNNKNISNSSKQHNDHNSDHFTNSTSTCDQSHMSSNEHSSKSSNNNCDNNNQFKMDHYVHYDHMNHYLTVYRFGAIDWKRDSNSDLYNLTCKNIKLKRYFDKRENDYFVTTIGRNCANTVVLDVSRSHAVFYADLGSHHGAYLNRNRVVQEKLQTGDTIKIAGCDVAFELTSKKHNQNTNASIQDGNGIVTSLSHSNKHNNINNDNLSGQSVKNGSVNNSQSSDHHSGTPEGDKENKDKKKKDKYQLLTAKQVHDISLGDAARGIITEQALCLSRKERRLRKILS